MNKKLKMYIAVGVVLLALGLLFAQGFKASGGMGVYLTIEEAMTGYNQDEDKFIQMEANIDKKSVRYDSKKPLLEFKLYDEKNNTIDVIFNDIMPDNFEAGYPVIVEGRFSGQGQFVAKKLLVKCPSKYEEKAEEK
jgi:cytochrome c-type biogenesis protein CcmE